MSRGWLHQTWKRTHQAAKDGDLDTIRAIAYKHGNVAALDADGRTPAHEAARLGHAHVLRALWPLGAERSLSARDPSGLLPAHFACMEGHEACLEVLMELVPETVSSRDRQGRCSKPEPEATLTPNSNPTSSPTESSPRFPAHLAARGGHLRVIERLEMVAPQTLVLGDKFGRCACHEAARMNQMECLMSVSYTHLTLPTKRIV
eukprot:TRINITY_DN1052_c0_g1_i4.p1 TRINITY_DN1052_c0_g1~~TRINITY_DN1052_c0_g1_i4.p1  ORF type:complete len:204 (-),score=25.40 TRINITY_DN1052_c0_g1_i4:93-704(-)